MRKSFLFAGVIAAMLAISFPALAAIPDGDGISSYHKKVYQVDTSIHQEKSVSDVTLAVKDGVTLESHPKMAVTIGTGNVRAVKSLYASVVTDNLAHRRMNL